MSVPYVDLAAQNRPLRERLLEAVGRVLDHGQFILGPEVEELETRLAERLGAAHVIGVASGTDALRLALELRGIGRGDEVLTVSHSFVATASAICLVGARPVFVDVDETTMTMDPGELEGALTARTKAVMPVHLNGSPAALSEIAAFCERHGLALIEDCAQAIGVRAQGEPVGVRDLGCFSLHPLKILAACGDAGFVTARTAEDAAELRRRRNIGLKDRDHCVIVSGNSRLDTLQAAILLVKLGELDGWIDARRAHAAAYRAAFAGRLVLPPAEGPGDFSIWSVFVVRHPRRDLLAERLRARGVAALVHYPLAIHQQEAFKVYADRPLPVTEKVVGEILSLPVSAELDRAGRERVIEATLESLAEVEGAA